MVEGPEAIIAKRVVRDRVESDELGDKGGGTMNADVEKMNSFEMAKKHDFVT
jgi:hypothetical protein